jgi:hypothetical protein
MAKSREREVSMTRAATDSPTISVLVTEKPAQTIVVPDRFFSKLWAVVLATFLHPFTTTIIRVVTSDGSVEK